MTVVVRVENVSKKYQLGKIGTQSFKGDFQRWWAKRRGKDDPFAKIGEQIQVENNEFWALRDINFEVKQGDAVGIIGKNGAGKSTLLKILSRITLPTTGSVKIKGRIASLLEVGTGFNPELTGRENIFLNGAILGMNKPEVKAKFDEIVDFSGIEKFIDTPVKRYSSGMYVRLAFAVAAHLESEILILDEVLAVGDAEFQKKCLGKMDDVAHKQGRTILFVSHSMAAVRSLCNKGILLNKGKIEMQGDIQVIADQYLEEFQQKGRDAQKYFEEDAQKDFQVVSVRLLTSKGVVTQNFDCDQPIIIELNCKINASLKGLYGYLALTRMDGTTVWVVDSKEYGNNPLDNMPIGFHTIHITLPPRILGTGQYNVYFNFASTQNIQGFHVDSPGIVCSFSLHDFTSTRGNNRGGYISKLLPWELKTNKIYVE